MTYKELKRELKYLHGIQVLRKSLLRSAIRAHANLQRKLNKGKSFDRQEVNWYADARLSISKFQRECNNNNALIQLALIRLKQLEAK